MDWPLYCVIDNKDDKDITEDILCIRKDASSSRYSIIFTNNPTEFHFSLDRITFLDKPNMLDISDKLVFIKGKLQPEINKIIQFDSWCKIKYFDGKRSTVPFSYIQLITNERKEQRISSVMDYLIEVAEIDDNKIASDNEEQNFIVSQLKDLEIREDSVLSTLLKNDKPSNREYSKPIIAPFSSNASQLKAIKRALKSQISVIQGPPGTGKTQTILNIISNLIVEGKTIAVVSGNNEATRNVYEKLEKEGLGFLCARLGNKANIDSFFSSLSSKESIRTAFRNIERKPNVNEIKELEEKVKKIYKSIARKAKYQSVINELETEKTANDYNRIILPKSMPIKLMKDRSSEGLLKNAAFIEILYSSSSWMFITKLKMLLRFGYWPQKDFSPSNAIDCLQEQYYQAKISELKESIDEIETLFPREENDKAIRSYQEESRKYLLYYLKKRYENMKDKEFSTKTYRLDQTFLDHFPIVLSTTHSLHYSSPRGKLFDYVIIDESSQVNLTSAFIALASAENAVIVGDSKQLPHVVPEKMKGPLDSIKKKYNLPDYIDYRRFSLLESILVAYGGNVYNTLLKEHYRCDPEIIGFCNKRFYDSQLIVQTKHENSCGIRIIETPSHTALGRTNPRQVEIIKSEILPLANDKEDIGIVAPYRDQVALIRDNIENYTILVDTVHKFQGKERSTIILSTTSDKTVFYKDPEQTDFLNNPNLINVAISRAKKELYVIATTEALNQRGTLLNDLYNYTQYYSTSSKHIKTTTLSVFDLMYDDYSPILKEMKERMKKVSSFSSENIVATVIDDICKSRQYGMLSFKFNYPLRKIISPDTIKDNEDRNFILSPGTHCDFVIFDDLNKRIQLIVEVDGKQHEKEIQKKRDQRKDRIINFFAIDMLRIKTTDVNVKEKIESILSSKKCV